MIVDVFMFDGEFDMLDCRLYELRGIVDLHVAVEADHTFSGLPKPYRLTEAEGCYEADPLRIVRAQTGDVDDITDAYLRHAAPWAYTITLDHWRREVKQRDAALEVIADLPDDTVLIVGDLDEIPKREKLMAAIANPVPLTLRMAHHVYSTRWRHPNPWYGSVVGRKGQLFDRPAIVRAQRVISYDWMFNAGWHLSWFGEPEDRVEKLTHSAHQERGDVGVKIATDYPTSGKHLNGSELMPWNGEVPTFIRDGLAPSSWTRDWR